eukprot:11208418-Lingulodinium_polyedra.AAC.1
MSASRFTRRRIVGVRVSLDGNSPGATMFSNVFVDVGVFVQDAACPPRAVRRDLSRPAYRVRRRI